MIFDDVEICGITLILDQIREEKSGFFQNDGMEMDGK